MSVTGHRKWCTRKTRPPDVGKFCSFCGESIRFQRHEPEEDRLSGQLAEAVDRIAALEAAIRAHREYVTVHSGMRGGKMDHDLWASIGTALGVSGVTP